MGPIGREEVKRLVAEEGARLVEVLPYAEYEESHLPLRPRRRSCTPHPTSRCRAVALAALFRYGSGVQPETAH
ncbi:MAG: hypothetical protein ACREQ9_04545 [Candidatus Binatia bacterium]